MNKRIIFTILALTSIINVTFGQTINKQLNDSVITYRLNDLDIKFQNLTKNIAGEKNDSLVISFYEFEEIKQLLQNNRNEWVPSLIAILVVLISTGGALLIGKKQIKNQIKNAEEQLRSQELQAQENLKMAREQLQETSKITLTQVRANNISQARINWMQDFRNEITNFNGEVAIINFYLQDVIDLLKNDQDKEAKDLYNNQIERIKTARKYAYKVKLFLNVAEKNHKKLEELIDKYIEEALENPSSVKSDFNNISNEILIVSRKILKEVWEQAKNEGD